MASELALWRASRTKCAPDVEATAKEAPSDAIRGFLAKAENESPDSVPGEIGIFVFFYNSCALGVAPRHPPELSTKL